MKLSKEKLFLCMAKACMTQGELADKAGMSRRTLSEIIHGRECRPDTLGRLSKALEVEPRELIA